MPVKYLSAEEQNELRIAEGSFNMIDGLNGFAGFVGIGQPEDDKEPKVMFWTHIARALVDDSFEHKDLTSVKDTLLKLRQSWCRPVEKVIKMIDQNLPGVEVLCAPVFSNPPIPSWSSNRVILIGDAAHGYGPGAQGAALAMEDAFLLASMLKDKANTVEVLAKVFKDFENKRRPRVERIGNASEARNNGRLVPKSWFKATLHYYMKTLMHWWYRNGYYDADYAYRVEDEVF